jgi:Mrp family chromosome partitioning ATPase
MESWNGWNGRVCCSSFTGKARHHRDVWQGRRGQEQRECGAGYVVSSSWKKGLSCILFLRCLSLLSSKNLSILRCNLLVFSSFCRFESKVGLLDVDLCGPSIPRMLGIEGRDVQQSERGWMPVKIENFGSTQNNNCLKVMSLAFLSQDRNAAVVWRGPKKTSVIGQFLHNVDWGDDLDYLIVDTPPGTSDEHITVTTELKVVFSWNFYLWCNLFCMMNVFCFCVCVFKFVFTNMLKASPFENEIFFLHMN